MLRSKPDHRDELIRRLMQQNADLQDRLMEMIGTVHSYQVAHHARDAGVGLPAPFSISGEEAGYVSEDEDDIHDLYDEGTIDKDAMLAAIAEAGFRNVEIFE